jgi:hypothetical protein
LHITNRFWWNIEHLLANQTRHTYKTKSEHATSPISQIWVLAEHNFHKEEKCLSLGRCVRYGMKGPRDWIAGDMSHP